MKKKARGQGVDVRHGKLQAAGGEFLLDSSLGIVRHGQLQAARAKKARESDVRESNVRHKQLPAEALEGPIRPLVPWCFGPAEGRLWRLASWNPAASESNVNVVVVCCMDVCWDINRWQGA